MTKSELIEIITAKQKHLPARDVELALKQILEINLRATGEMNERLADLQTTITAPDGHSVVLGVSPVGPLTSVFVVQVRR